jgi:hypothetical protein
MTVLLEGMSLVFENRVLDKRFSGGTKGFRMTWDNGSFCTDGTISRLSFFESNDGFCMLMAMPTYGLEVSTQFAIDVGVVLHGGRPWAPCLWLEISAENDGRWCCWSTAKGRSDQIFVPSYFRPGQGLASFGHMDEDDMRKGVVRAGEADGVSLFRDQVTSDIFGGPRPLRRH